VAFTYNDPVIFLEYAVDVARACRDHGIATVAVTAAEILPEPRREFFSHMDAANVDLKAFTDDFYRRLCGGSLEPVLECLEYLAHETDVWIELTTLIIPGENDSDDELNSMTAWVVERLGPAVPMHFTAFHPDFKMLGTPATPSRTLTRAREIALANGVTYAYTGNVHDRRGGSTYCARCGQLLVGRDWYQLTAWNLDDGACSRCGTPCPGRFDKRPGSWGPRRLPVRISDYCED
jgi:pyruvate formate lyase activating enzyme